MKSLLLLLFLVSIPLAPLSPPMTRYVMTSDIGFRVSPLGGDEEFLHRGVDLVGPENCSILAAEDGVVLVHYPPPGTKDGKRVFKGHPIFGGYIVLQHGNGLLTIYGHMKQTFVHTNQFIPKGKPIGVQGETGTATGPHLHFEVVISPLALFDRPIGMGIVEFRNLLR